MAEKLTDVQLETTFRKLGQAARAGQFFIIDEEKYSRLYTVRPATLADGRMIFVAAMMPKDEQALRFVSDEKPEVKKSDSPSE